MLHRIKQYIIHHHLPQPPAQILVALSGGADSIALTLILHELGYSLCALHCNFHLRGEESNRDEQFVIKFCKKYQIPFQVKHFDTINYAKEKSISIEMAARELRYSWFEQQRRQMKACAVAVAHHSDDNAETLLLNLIRGSGIKGLKGMLPQQGYIIRPLLNVNRHDLEQYLEEKKQDYVTDSTNLETIYKRNKIRHEVLPLLRQLNPSIDHCLAETAERLTEASQLYDEAINHLQLDYCKKTADGISIHLDRLQQHPCAATLLHEFLQPYGFTSAAIRMISQHLQCSTGATFESTTHVAVFHRGSLQVQPIAQRISPTLLPESGILTLNNGVQIQVEQKRIEQLTAIPKQRDKVALALDNMERPLFIRSLQNGDRFQPFGMKGKTQLVSNYLTNHHRSLIEKQKTLAMCDKKGIVWLVGERVSQRAAITNTTKEVLLLTLIH